MNWIKVEIGLLEKPKVIRISDITGLDEYAVVGRLIKLWAWADRHVECAGKLAAVEVTDAFIDRHLSHLGFSKALQDVDWLRRKNEKLFLKNFHEHNGKTAKDRAESAARMVKSRVNAKKNGCGNVAENPQQKPNNSATREEKRREEKNRVNTLGESIAPTDAEWLSELRETEAYIGLDVQREFSKMQTWCQANSKQPTRRRFINWLNRADKPMMTRAVASAPKPYIPGVSR